MSNNQLQKQIVQQGTGDVVPQNASVFVHYTGKFLNGQVFDSSISRGNPLTFLLNQGQVIRGWDLCVSSMRQGEKCILTCPPEYGYGDRQVGPIPPNSTLIFEIELLGWN